MKTKDGNLRSHDVDRIGLVEGTQCGRVAESRDDEVDQDAAGCKDYKATHGPSNVGSEFMLEYFHFCKFDEARIISPVLEHVFWS